MSNAKAASCTNIDLSEFDVIAAMKEMQGYIDISPGDFKEVFRIAYAHALRRIMEGRKAKDLMSSPVQCLQADMDLVQAAKFLADLHLSGAPVLDGAGKVVGVISEKDFLLRMGIGRYASMMQVLTHCLSNKGCMVMDLRGYFVRDIMSTPPLTAGPETSMAEISSLFTNKNINRLPIVDDQGSALGIVTRSNLVQSFCLPGGGQP